ncbi:DoxX family protein [Nocardiopsis composta]
MVPPLAALEFAGAAGLLIGLLYRPLGIAAGIGLVLYFIGAVAAHVRAKDLQGAPGPAVLLAASAATVVFGLATV